MRNGDIKIDMQAGSRTSDHADKGMRVVYSYEDYLIRTGWALEVAASTPVSLRINPAQYIIYNQHEYPSKAALCCAHGITTTLVYSTLNSYKIEGWVDTFDLIISF